MDGVKKNKLKVDVFENNCGDGRRFTLPCDDGNNNNGDGCSSDCRV